MTSQFADKAAIVKKRLGDVLLGFNVMNLVDGSIFFDIEFDEFELLGISELITLVYNSYENLIIPYGTLRNINAISIKLKNGGVISIYPMLHGHIAVVMLLSQEIPVTNVAKVLGPHREQIEHAVREIV